MAMKRHKILYGRSSYLPAKRERGGSLTESTGRYNVNANLSADSSEGSLARDSILGKHRSSDFPGSLHSPPPTVLRPCSLT